MIAKAITQRIIEWGKSETPGMKEAQVGHYKMAQIEGYTDRMDIQTHMTESRDAVKEDYPVTISQSSVGKQIVCLMTVETY